MFRPLKATPFEGYFWISLLLGLPVFALEALTGRSGFSVTPLVNAMWAISIFAFSLMFILHRALQGKPVVILREGIVPFTLITLNILIGVGIGAFSGNAKVYLLSTTVYWINWLLFSVAISLYSIEYTEKRFYGFLKKYVPMLSILKILGLGGSATGTTFLVSAIVLSTTFYKSRKLLVWAIAPFLFSLSGLNRGTLIAISGAFFISALVRRSALWILSLLGSLFFLSSFLFFGDLTMVAGVGTPLFRRLNEVQELMRGTNSLDSMVALQQRIFEIELVNRAIASSFTSTIFGNGFGATVDMSVSSDASVTSSALLGSTKVHNIHSLYHSILLRSGYLGILFLIAFVTSMTALIWNAFKFNISDSVVGFCIIFTTASLLNGLPASNFFLTEFGLLGIQILAWRRLRLIKFRQLGRETA